MSKVNKVVLGLIFMVFFFSTFAQEPGDVCSQAGPLCADAPITFPAGVNTPNAESGPNYGCLSSQPNPAWYYIRIDQTGDIEFTLQPTPQNDIDFALWGPYTDLSNACDNLTADCDGLFNPCINFPSGNLVDCSFDAQATETVSIPNGQVGEYYILLITNFSNDPTEISIELTGGTGGTDCSEVVLCQLDLDAGIDTTICYGDSITLTGQYSNEEGNVTYQWSSDPVQAINDLDDTTSLTPVFNPSASYGDVEFTLTAIDDGPTEGPCEVSQSVTISVIDLVIDSLTQIESECGLSTGQVQAFISGFSQNTSFEWRGPGAQSTDFVNDTIWENIPSGWYYFTIQEEDCSFMDSILVQEEEAPSASISASPEGGNVPVTITFTNNSQDGESYSWDFGNGDGNVVSDLSSQEVTYTEEGDYEITLVATAGGCSDTTTTIVNITDFAPLIYDLPNIFTPNGDQVNDLFTINAQNAVSLEMVILNRWGNVVFESKEDLNPSWNGKVDNMGSDVGPGTYFYKFIITGEDGVSKEEHGAVQLLR